MEFFLIWLLLYSWISLTNDRHIIYFYGDSVFSSIFFASPFRFLFMSASCYPQLLYASILSASLASIFSVLLPQSAFFLLALIYILIPDLFFSNLLLYIFLIQYQFILLLPCWFLLLVDNSIAFLLSCAPCQCSYASLDCDQKKLHYIVIFLEI